MKDATESLGDAHSMASDHSRHRTTDVDALTPDNPSRGVTYLTLFMSVFSVGTGIALFTVGDTPTGLPIPVLSLVFIAAGILIWFGAALEMKQGIDARMT